VLGKMASKAELFCWLTSFHTICRLLTLKPGAVGTPGG
jgi:hypothetical protein